MHFMLSYKNNVNDYISVKRWRKISGKYGQTAHSSLLHLWIVVNMISLWPHGPWYITSCNCIVCMKFSCMTNNILKTDQTTFRYPATGLL